MGQLLLHSHEFKGAWKDLPEELVHNISSRLIGRDFAALQAACKSWKSASTTSFAIRTPCLLMCSNDTSSLHYPISNSFVVGTDVIIYDLPTNYNNNYYSFFKLQLVANEYRSLQRHVILHVKINLPPIHLAVPLCSFSFSTPPTSPDCTVFCITTTFYHEIDFCILKRGQTNWTVLEFDTTDHIQNFKASTCNSLLYKGDYYCFSKHVDLVIYDPDEDHEPLWVKSATTFLRNRLSTKRCQSYMAESDGELLAVFMSCDGEWVQVCKLDECRMIWVPLHNLGDKSLFISIAATFVETISVKGAEKKVYLPCFRGRGNKQMALFYCLATRRYKSFGADWAACSYTCLYESTRPASTTWIKPVSHHLITSCHDPQFEFTSW